MLCFSPPLPLILSAFVPFLRRAFPVIAKNYSSSERWLAGTLAQLILPPFAHLHMHSEQAAAVGRAVQVVLIYLTTEIADSPSARVLPDVCYPYRMIRLKCR